MVKPSDFEWRESPAPTPKDGEALVRVLYVSFDPAMRGWMEDRPSYIRRSHSARSCARARSARWSSRDIPT